MEKVKGLFKLLRIELPISAGICVVMGQLLTLGRFPSLIVITLGFLSVFLISASILVLNDFFDIETDKINSPNRPIASGIISPNEALGFSVFLLLLGLFLGYLLNYITLFSAIILSIVGFLYNSKFKKSGLLGNLMVSFSVGMTFIFGGISVGLPFNKMAWYFGIIAALIDLGEEIAADTMDMEGDKIISSNSLAIKYGKGFALKISKYIFWFVVFLTLIPFPFNWFPILYIIPILIMDVSILYSTYRLLLSKNDEGRKFIRWIYMGSTLGILIFIIMRFFEM